MAYSGVLSLRTIIESTLAKAGGHLSESTLAKAAAEASGVSLATVQREIRQMVDYGQLWAREKGRGRTIYALGTWPGAITREKITKASSLAMDGPGTMDTVGQREAAKVRQATPIRNAIRQSLDRTGGRGERALAVSVAEALGVDAISVGLEVTAMVQVGELLRKSAGKWHTVWLASQPAPKRPRRNWVKLQLQAAATPDTPPETTPAGPLACPRAAWFPPSLLGHLQSKRGARTGRG